MGKRLAGRLIMVGAETAGAHLGLEFHGWIFLSPPRTLSAMKALVINVESGEVTDRQCHWSECRRALHGLGMG